jgi:hypothetical protein
MLLTVGDNLESVFLSYRREDSAGYAGRLAEHLGSDIGHQHVFMDVQDIVPGQDFAHAIENTIAACQAVMWSLDRAGWQISSNEAAATTSFFTRCRSPCAATSP